MSIIFRASESLGESKGKTLSQNLKKILIKGVKSAGRLIFFYFFFAKFRLNKSIIINSIKLKIQSRDALSPVCGIFFFSLFCIFLLKSIYEEEQNQGYNRRAMCSFTKFS